MGQDTFDLPYMIINSIIMIMLASKQKGKGNAFVNGYSDKIHFDLIFNKTHEVRIIVFELTIRCMWLRLFEGLTVSKKN